MLSPTGIPARAGLIVRCAIYTIASVGSKGEFHSKALDTDDSFSFTFAKAGSYAYSYASE
jgi:hypothetical protein